MVLYNNKLQCNYYTVDEATSIFDKIIKNNPITYVGGRRTKYVDISASFDIESSNFYKLKNKELQLYIETKGKHKVKHKVNNKVALMYIWQFGVTDDKTGETYCIVGRYWKQFIKLLEIIKEKFVDSKNDGKHKTTYLFPIFIHNLSFEFSFLRPLLLATISDVFAVKANTPLYFRTDSIEFRCSYLLSGMALKYLPTTKFKKLDGDLDYDKIRHALTPLTDTEMAYCLSDVLVLCEYISIKREQDGNIAKIPYTKTGYVRRGIREHCIGTEWLGRDRWQYIELINKLQINTLGDYEQLKRAYQGGHTACNPWYNGKLVRNVTCYDFTSSYPAVMCMSDRFPIEYKETIKKLNEEEYKDLLEDGYAVVSAVTFTNLRQKHNFDAWIPSSKIFGEYDEKDLHLNNGKVTRYDGKLKICITNIDYEIYSEFYEWDEAIFESNIVYRTGYLPRKVIEYVLKLYSEKSKLKGVKGKKLFYALLKELLNSLYGMCVTDPLKQMIECDDNGDWHTPKFEINENTFELLCAYNKKITSGAVVTPYIWGIYVSAFARQNLSYGIVNSGLKGLWIYADTDSIYVKDAYKIKDFIDTYNNDVIEQMDAMCEHYGFDKSIYRPIVDGDEKILGVWDFDGHYKYFKTLGAKRYIKWVDKLKIKVKCLGKTYKTKHKIKVSDIRKTQDHLLKIQKSYLIITVAGLGKTQGRNYLFNTYNKSIKEIFDNFAEHLTIPAKETGKLTHEIITQKREGDVTDYLGNTTHYVSYGGTHLEPTTFNLSLDALYVNYLLDMNTEEYY